MAVVRSPATAVSAGEASDVQLVRAAASGDRGAFGTLYQRFARMVHGVLLAHAPREEADDLVHDVFLVALQRLPALRDPFAFGGWLAAIARNQARMHVRRAPRVIALSDQLPESRVEDTEAAAIIAAIGALPDAYRETLVLRLVEGLSGAEIAARTGLTPGSVRVNLHRGMKLLRERLGGPDA
jgi:RNA polymerase sigma-70 factor (ECF subfamily)